MKTFPHTCPYCGHASTVVEENFSVETHYFTCHNKENSALALTTAVTVCPNPKCKEYCIDAHLIKARYNGVSWTHIEPVMQTWRLRPKSKAKQFPSYIPKPILTDYEEACLICDLSPKASATLSRRALQGIIRDFFGIQKARLIDEIQELQSKIDPLTWQAIDATRNIGNIGAHMEKDINLIIDVDAKEAAVLIGLIEMLLTEWYIHREERKIQLESLVQISAAKAAQKK
mgnify:CR=1 FL=1